MAEIERIISQEWPGQIPPGGINSDSKMFYEGIGLDSADGVSLILALEERFGIEIDHQTITMDVFETLGTLAAFVEDHLNAVH
jgi:acyl carrier protein